MKVSKLCASKKNQIPGEIVLVRLATKIKASKKLFCLHNGLQVLAEHGNDELMSRFENLNAR